MRVATWSELGGGVGWAREIRRLSSIMQCRTSHFERFDATCRLLEPWRLRSPVQCNRDAIQAILPILERAKRGGGCGWLDRRPPWSRAELGELLVIARNRAALYAIGRDRPKAKGPRLDPTRLPLSRLEALIQHHRDLGLVEQLRAERNRRIDSEQRRHA